MPEPSRRAPESAPPDLAAEFPAASLAAWRIEVERMLRGAPWEKAMTSATPEGVVLRALYTAEDVGTLEFRHSLPGDAPFVRGAHLLGYRLDPWEVAQEIPYPEPAVYNEALRRDLDAGQTAAVLVWDAAGRAGLDPGEAPAEQVGRGGTSISSHADLALALDSVDAGATPIFLHAGTSTFSAAALCFAHLFEREADFTRLRGSFGTDPLADALAGSLASLDAAYDRLAALTSWLEEHTRPGDFHARSLMAWGARWPEAGASAVEELSLTLASAVQSLREMERRGVDPVTAASRIGFGFGIGPQFLMETAKFRAARLLWGRVCEACGLEDPPASMWIHARTLRRNLSAIDPQTNILRATTEAISAVLGGCDSLTVLPFDAPLGLPSEPARRLARNTQLILREESHLDLVIDAVGGSYAIEALTAELAEKAWARFRETEVRGGLRKYLETGKPQEQAAAAAEKHREAVATRRETMVGVNQYPNANEPDLSYRHPDHAAIRARREAEMAQQRAARDGTAVRATLAELARVFADSKLRTKSVCLDAAIEAARHGATLGEISAAVDAKADSAAAAPLPALPTRRQSEEFEALRSRARSARMSDRPRVLLACFGPVLEYLPRLEFTRSFFRLAGLALTEPVECGEDADGAVELIQSAAEGTRAPLVVLVSTDARYPGVVPAVAAALKRLPSVRSILLAGLPSGERLAAAFREAGVDEFLHQRSDAPALLGALLEKIGGRS